MRQKVNLQGTRIAFALVGVLIALVPLVDDLISVPYQAFVLIPLFFAFGFYGYYTIVQEDDLSLFSLGIGIFGLTLMGAGSLLLAISSGAPFASVYIIAVPSVLGYALFTFTMAYLLRTSETVTSPRWVSVALIVLPALDPVINAVLTPILSVGLSITGLSWLLVSLTLRAENSNSTNPNPVRQPAD